MLTNFVNYVDSFYGQDDPLYPLMSRETKQPLTKYDILRATENYLSMCSDDSNELCTWGDGDSLDRERVRDILLEEYNYKYVGEQSPLNCPFSKNIIETMIKLGSNVKSKIHDDLTGHVVVYQPLNNYAVVMTDIIDYEMMTVECFLSDLEVA